MIALATFVLGMRAARLHDALRAEGIGSRINQPAWKNKRLPPPKIAVEVEEADLERAKVVLAAFLAGK